MTRCEMQARDIEMIEPIKLAVHPKTGEVRGGHRAHADALSVTDFDQWVRVLAFPSRRRVYFRFYKPDGDFYFVTEADRAASFNICYLAREALIKTGQVKKSWKVLYWE